LPLLLQASEANVVCFMRIQPLLSTALSIGDQA
jgi:hypothetical protein